jgi:hypothetical protein
MCHGYSSACPSPCMDTGLGPHVFFRMGQLGDSDFYERDIFDDDDESKDNQAPGPGVCRVGQLLEMLDSLRVSLLRFWG